jgi:hypothetical protein
MELTAVRLDRANMVRGTLAVIAGCLGAFGLASAIARFKNTPASVTPPPSTHPKSYFADRKSRFRSQPQSLPQDDNDDSRRVDFGASRGKHGGSSRNNRGGDFTQSRRGKSSRNHNDYGYQDKSVSYIGRHAGRYMSRAQNEEQRFVELANVVDRISDTVVQLSYRRGLMQTKLAGHVSDGFLITTDHFFVLPDGGGYLPEGTPFTVAFRDRSFDIRFRKRDLTRFSDTDPTDMVRYRLPSGTPLPKSISRFFATRDDVASMSRFTDFSIIKPSRHGPYPDALAQVEQSNFPITWKVGDSVYGSPAYLTYPIQAAGDCGSLVVGVDTNRGIVRIFGMHVAQRRNKITGTAVGVAIQFPSAFSATPQSLECCGVPHKTTIKQVSSPVEMTPRVEFVGKSIQKIPGGVMKTKLRLSPISHFYEHVTTQPALLGDPSDPRCGGRTKIDLMLMETNRAKPFELKLDEETCSELGELFWAEWGSKPHTPPRVLSTHEAINGSVDFPRLHGVKMGTGAGHPLNLYSDEPGKWSFFTGPPGEREIIGQARVELEASEELLLAGEDPQFIFKNNLKDEARSAKKIKNLRTRVVCGAPLAHTLLMRKYFGSLIDHLKGSYPTSASAVGMNVNSPDWQTMYNRWSRTGSNGFDGDFRKFEQYFCKEIADAIWGFVRRFYASHTAPEPLEVVAARKNLLYSTLNSLVLIGPFLFRNRWINPSGTFGTTVLFNNFLAFGLLYIAWRKLAPERVRSAHGFLEYVSVKVYGDDNASAVHANYEECYNFLTVQEVFEGMGIVYTPADKGENALALKPIRDLEFLKNTSRCDRIVPGTSIYGVPELLNVDSSLRWIRNSKGALEAIEDNCEDALRRVFGYGRKHFDELREKFISQLGTVGSTKRLITFAACRDLWLSGELSSIHSQSADSSDMPYIDTQPSRGVAENAWLAWYVNNPVCPTPGCKNRVILSEGTLLCDFCLVDPYASDLFGVEAQASVVRGEAKVDVAPTESVGVSFQDLEAPQISTGGRNLSRMLPNSDNSERPLRFADVVERFQFVDEFQWPSSAPTHEILWSGSVPWELITSPSMISAFDTFVYHRSKVLVKIQIQAQPFQCGQLIAYFVPHMTEEEILLHIARSRSSQILCPHTLGNAGSTREMVLAIPFAHFRQRLDTNLSATSRGDLGTLVIAVFNPLVVGPSAPPSGDVANVSVYASFPDIDFQVLDPEENVTARARAQAALYEVIPQMNSAPAPGPEPLPVDDSPLGAQDTLPVTRVAPIERARPAVARDIRVNNITEFAKRKVLLYKGLAGTLRLPSSNLVYGKAEGSHTLSSYYAALYRMWRGSVQYIVTSDSDIRALYDYRSLNVVGELLQNSLEGDGTLLGFAPTTAGLKRATQMQFIAPYQSPYHVLLLPLSAAERNFLHCSPGVVAIDPDASDANAAVYMSGGDDTSFGYLFRVPELVVGSLPIPNPPTQAEQSVVFNPQYETHSQGNFKSNVSNVSQQVTGSIDYKSGAQSSGNGELTLDYPNIGVTPIGFVRHPLPDLANVTGVSQARVLDANPGRRSDFTQGIYGNDDPETSLAYLFSRKSLLTTFRWSVTQSSGTELYSAQLCPQPGLAQATSVGQVVQPTLLGYVTLPFAYWRGSLRVTVQVICSKFHTGRIAICAHFGRDSNLIVDLNSAMSQYARIIDITAGNTTFEVEFPWKTSQEMLHVSSGISGVPLREASMGTWSIRVVNPLQANESISDTVDVNVFWCAGDDFQVDFPRGIPTGWAVSDPFRSPTKTFLPDEEEKS